MAALNTDLVRLTTPNFATTLANSMLISDTSMTLQTATGLLTTTAITLVIDATDPVSGVATPNLKEVVTGTLSGAVLSNLVRGQDGTTQQAHAAGANVVMWWNANMINDFMNSFLAQHKQLGTHTGITTDTITASANATVGGTLGVTGAATFVNMVLGGTLTGSGLANQILTQANAGTAGGTMSYINLAGIKLLWCRTGALTANNNTSTTYTFTFPTSFFTTTTANFLTTENNTVSDRINVFFSVATTTTGTTIALRDFAAAGAATTQVNLFVIGT